MGGDEGVDSARELHMGAVFKERKKNVESVCLESGSFVFQAVMKSFLSFLAESLSAGRNDVKVSTTAVNFTPSESNRRSRFFFPPLRAWTPYPDDSPSVVCCELQQAASCLTDDHVTLLC